MAIDYNRENVGSGYSRTPINNNFQKIDDALDGAISRFGVAPNQMEADFDMNGNDILNVDNIDVSTLTIDGIPVAVNGEIPVNPDSLVPVGGTDGQVLTKTSGIDYETAWETLPVVHELPAAGTTGQLLAKNSATDYDVEWIDSSGGLEEVATRTALKALDTTTITTCSLTETNRQGIFQWRTGNFTSLHALDTQEAVYIKADAIASTAGSWVRVHNGTVNVEWFGAVHDNATDDTTALNKFFAFLPVAKVQGFLPSGQYSITNTINIGDGTSTTRSTTNGFVCTFETMGNPLGILNPSVGIPKVGVIFNWDGSAGGTMFQVNGPIHGLRFFGALQLDGDRSAAKGFRALSMSFSQFDAITAMHCTGTNIELDVQAATTIAGDANGITTASNEFQEVNCGSPDQANSICMSWDGYKVAGGLDVTNNRFRRVTTYIDLTNGKGLYWGFSDFNIIDQLVGIGYGAVSGTPAGVHLAGTATPFNAPDLNVIKQASVGHGVSVTASGSPGNNYIELYSLNDSAVMPVGVAGISGRTLSATDADDRQTFGDWEQHKISVPGNDDGLYLVVGATEIGAIVRDTNDVRYRSFANHKFDGDVIADAGRFKVDRTSADAILEAATTTSGNARILLTNNGNQGYELYADRTNNRLDLKSSSFTFLSSNAGTGLVTAAQGLSRGVPVTKTGDFTLAATETWVLNNKGSACVVTLPSAATWPGREVHFTNIGGAFALTSASSNVVPKAGGAAGTAILAATDGAWATLVSDGSNWIIMQAGT